MTYCSFVGSMERKTVFQDLGFVFVKWYRPTYETFVVVVRIFEIRFQRDMMKLGVGLLRMACSRVDLATSPAPPLLRQTSGLLLTWLSPLLLLWDLVTSCILANTNYFLGPSFSDRERIRPLRRNQYVVFCTLSRDSFLGIRISWSL